MTEKNVLQLWRTQIERPLSLARLKSNSSKTSLSTSKSTPKIWASGVSNCSSVLSRKSSKFTGSDLRRRQFQSSWSRSPPRCATPTCRAATTTTTTSRTRTGGASTAASPSPIRRSTSCTAASTARRTRGAATAAASSVQTWCQHYIFFFLCNWRRGQVSESVCL